MREDQDQAALFRSASTGHPAEEQLLAAESRLGTLEDLPMGDQVGAYGELHTLLTDALAGTAEVGPGGQPGPALAGDIDLAPGRAAAGSEPSP